MPFGQGLTLAFAQLAAEFQDGVAFRQRVQGPQFQQKVGGHDASTSAEFKNFATAERVQNLLTLAGQAARKQRRQFRRGDEIAAGTELASAGAVIAQAGRVQGQVHEPGNAMAPPASAISARKMLRATGRCVRWRQNRARAGW